jgi:pimeloyl-ACP methyl ester carboxylesterase
MLRNPMFKGFGRFRVQILLIALFIAVFSATSALAVVPYDTISGTLPDATPWAMVKPISNWNGTIILDLDGSSVKLPPPSVPNPNPAQSKVVQWLLDHGYAYGGTNRLLVAYNFPKAVENLVTVRSLFSAQYGVPARTIAWGSSRGGFVGRLCMELRPDIFNGAIVMAGGGGGEIAVLNSKLDSLFVLKTLVDPTSPLKIVGVPNITADKTAEDNALIALVNKANLTPEGRARLAFAAAVEQFAPWTVAGTLEPAAKDYDAQYAQLVAFAFGNVMNYVFANPIVVRAPIEELAGGVVSWNQGIDYTEMLARSGRADFVKAMYKKAGLNLVADLRTLAKAPRIAADPDAVAKAEKLMSYTGEINGPVINIDNIGDPVDPPSMKLAYRDTVNRAGNGKLFRLVWVRRSAHGGQSDLERIAAFTTLINRLDTGKWGDTSADAMNALAQEIATQPNVFTDLNPLFIKFHADKLLRQWDVSNWDTYEPCKPKHVCIAPEFLPIFHHCQPHNFCR